MLLSDIDVDCITTNRCVRDELWTKGVSRIRPHEFLLSPSLEPHRVDLKNCYGGLSLDPYAENKNRRRRHGRFLLLPWSNTIIYRPVGTYHQDKSYNPEDGGHARQLPGLTQRIVENIFLRELIKFDFWNLPISDDLLTQAFDVGIHLISMVAKPGCPGTSSPDHLHKDGEPFTYIHLIGRQNIVGGESVVSDNQKRVLVETILSGFLDTLVVADEAVYHWAKRIHVENGHDYGVRDVLLVDFTPLKADIPAVS